MTKRNSIPLKTLKLLFAYSGNCCAFEGCYSPIFENDGTLTGECCHIESYSPNGPRFNKQQTDKERNGYDNLILMCARHHKIIDTHPEEYSVEKLKSLKKTHESRYYSQQLEATGLMLHQLQTDSEKYWSSLKSLDKKDDKGFKMELGDNDLYSLMKDIEELYVGLNNSIDSITESSLRLQDDIKIECEKCGIDYSLFDKIPYYENSLVNRDWETVSLSFPNHLAKLKTRYFQLCVNLLEKIVISNPDLLDLLDKCKKELRSSHESAYYVD